MHYAEAKKHICDNYVIWVNPIEKTSGIQSRKTIKKWYGAIIHHDLNVAFVNSVKTDINGLTFYQPDARIVSDILHRHVKSKLEREDGNEAVIFS